MFTLLMFYDYAASVLRMWEVGGRWGGNNGTSVGIGVGHENRAWKRKSGQKGKVPSVDWGKSEKWDLSTLTNGPWTVLTYKVTSTAIVTVKSTEIKKNRTSVNNCTSTQIVYFNNETRSDVTGEADSSRQNGRKKYPSSKEDKGINKTGRWR